MKGFLYAVYSNYRESHVLSIHRTQRGAEAARLRFALNHIRNFKEIFQNYYHDWITYHSIEFPDYPNPSKQILLEQFLSEECYLSVDGFEADDCSFFGRDQDQVADLFDPMFYENLKWASTQHTKR